MAIVQAYRLQWTIKRKAVAHARTVTVRRHDGKYQAGGVHRSRQGLQARGMHTIIVGQKQTH
jgi:hypothetical protein